MNKKQKIVLWIGIIVFVLMGLCPPWFSRSFRPPHDKQNLGYYPIMRIGTGSIDFDRLALQWSIVVVITGGFFITFKDTKK